MNKYANELKEVYVILSNLEEEDYIKIPKRTIQAIEENMNDDYEYEIDENIELKDNEMLPGTKEFLFNIFRDYLATEEQREKIKRMQNEDREKLEQKKKEQYTTDIFKNSKQQKEYITNEVVENQQMIEYKENIFKRIFRYLKNIFRRSNNGK